MQANPEANAAKAREWGRPCGAGGGSVKAAFGLVGAGPGQPVRQELAEEVCGLDGC